MRMAKARARNNSNKLPSTSPMRFAPALAVLLTGFSMVLLQFGGDAGAQEGTLNPAESGGIGFAGMLAMVATLTLAADCCAPGAEGFTFATLMAVGNLASTLANNVGAFLYTHVFDQNLRPLVVISAAVTAVAFFVVPLLQPGARAVPFRNIAGQDEGPRKRL